MLKQYFGLLKNIKNNFISFFLLFLNVATRKFKFIYVALTLYFIFF